MKLTKPQRELLLEICNGDNVCVEEYLPAMKLVALGLAEFRFPSRLYPTNKGRTALQESKP